MSAVWLALRNIAGSPLRSGVVGLCAMMLAGLALSTLLIARDAQQSLQLAQQRLGADIIVVPAGGEERVESALLMGAPAPALVPRKHLQTIAAIPGVGQVSPQLYVASLRHPACCPGSEMLLVAFDAETDFTVRPWLRGGGAEAVRPGEAIGGASIALPPGESAIKLYGDSVTLAGSLAPTGTAMDRSLFFTFETAARMLNDSDGALAEPLGSPPGSISAALVRVAPGGDPADVAVRILQALPDVTPIESPDLFSGFRRQLTGLLRAVGVVLGITGLLALVLVSIVFSMTANERRREIGVLRALGAPQGFAVRVLVSEAGLLALVGALPGIALAVVVVHLFRTVMAGRLGVPFLLPSPQSLLSLVLAGILLALAAVMLAAWFPAWRLSQHDAAAVMRE